jgi:hypothetical protein
LNTAARATTWSSFERLIASEYARNSPAPRAVENVFIWVLEHRGIDAAQPYLTELISLLPERVWPLAYQLHLDCVSGQLDPSLTDEMLARAAGTILQPGDIHSLRRLDELVRAGKCPEISADWIQEFAGRLADNPRAHIPQTRVMALTEYGRIAANREDFETARLAFRNALRVSQTLPRNWRRFTMQELADAASETGNHTEAVAFVYEVASGIEDSYEGIEVDMSLSSE